MSKEVREWVETELMHFGVKGMKWGKRKTNYTDRMSLGAKYHNKAAKRIQKDADNLLKNGYKNEVKAVQKVADKQRAKATTSQNKYIAKRERKQAINDAYKTIKKSQSVGSRLKYNNSVYKKAAKNMVDKGMDQKKAVSKAKMSAWGNYGMIVAGNILISNSDKIISGIQKYANQKAIQRANAGLARIGTMKLVKVAGNVYEYKMK